MIIALPRCRRQFPTCLTPLRVKLLYWSTRPVVALQRAASHSPASALAAPELGFEQEHLLRPSALIAQRQDRLGGVALGVSAVGALHLQVKAVAAVVGDVVEAF